jgi:hypothetical protein
MKYFLFRFDDSLEVNRECRLISNLREKQERKVNYLVGLERQSIGHSKGSFREKEELIISFEKI